MNDEILDMLHSFDELFEREIFDEEELDPDHSMIDPQDREEY